MNKRGPKDGKRGPRRIKRDDIQDANLLNTFPTVTISKKEISEALKYLGWKRIFVWLREQSKTRGLIYDSKECSVEFDRTKWDVFINTWFEGPNFCQQNYFNYNLEYQINGNYAAGR